MLPGHLQIYIIVWYMAVVPTILIIIPTMIVVVISARLSLFFVEQEEASRETTQVYARCFNRDALHLRERTGTQGTPSSFYIHTYIILLDVHVYHYRT